MVNINKLKAAIIEKGLNVSQLATDIGMDKSTLYRRISANGDEFTLGEVDSIKKALSLTNEEARQIFFA